ncbi:MAG: MBL fold metallo-hydrolase [Lachnospiraceae bacterium]|nr:MBL fold metallo-hydrolase [Lachnospiraceae bacterium]
MRIQAIASGSNGNCIYIEEENTRILVDAGISCRRIGEALALLGTSPASLSGILITHEHADHVMGLAAFVRRLHIPVYTCSETASAIRFSDQSRLAELNEFREIRPGEPFRVGSLRILPIPTHHDAAAPVSFRVEGPDRTFAVLTDTGCIDEDMIAALQGLNGILLESNHDIRMLEAGSYPFVLKRRILGDFGHLSNESAIRILDRLMNPGMKLILLGHISEENNYPELVELTLRQFLEQVPTERKDPDLIHEVAVRTHSSAVFEL